MANAILLPSIQSLHIEMRAYGNPLATGTGFVMNSSKGPVLITNRHNFTGQNNVTGEYMNPNGYIPNEFCITYNKRNSLHFIQKIEPILDDFEPLWIEHPTWGKTADFGALLLKNLDDVQLHPYDEATETKIKVSPSDTISVVGFPFGLSGGGLAIWSTGFMATEHFVNYENHPKFLIDCRSRPGQSGSAVIAQRNSGMVELEGHSRLKAAAYSIPVTRLLGIYSGRINAQSDLGIVWKVSAIRELTNSI